MSDYKDGRGDYYLAAAAVREAVTTVPSDLRAAVEGLPGYDVTVDRDAVVDLDLTASKRYVAPPTFITVTTAPPTEGSISRAAVLALIDAHRCISTSVATSGPLPTYGELMETVPVEDGHDHDAHCLCLPIRVVVDQHGHYWRDYGDGWSMCPVSPENLATEPISEFYPLDAHRCYDEAALAEALRAVQTTGTLAYDGPDPRPAAAAILARLRGEK